MSVVSGKECAYETELSVINKMECFLVNGLGD